MLGKRGGDWLALFAASRHHALVAQLGLGRACLGWGELGFTADPLVAALACLRLLGCVCGCCDGCPIQAQVSICWICGQGSSRFPLSAAWCPAPPCSLVDSCVPIKVLVNNPTHPTVASNLSSVSTFAAQGKTHCRTHGDRSGARCLLRACRCWPTQLSLLVQFLILVHLGGILVCVLPSQRTRVTEHTDSYFGICKLIALSPASSTPQPQTLDPSTPQLVGLFTNPPANRKPAVASHTHTTHTTPTTTIHQLTPYPPPLAPPHTSTCRAAVRHELLHRNPFARIPPVASQTTQDTPSLPCPAATPRMRPPIVGGSLFTLPE